VKQNTRSDNKLTREMTQTLQYISDNMLVFKQKQSQYIQLIREAYLQEMLNQYL